MHALLEKLKGGDFRSIGRSAEVMEAVLAHPGLFAVLMSGLTAEDALVRMRAADVAEKLTGRHPDWLGPYRQYLLNEVMKIDQQEVRWHVALMLPRLELTVRERRKVVSTLKTWLTDKSRIVQTFSLQALADLSKQDRALRSEVMRLIREKVQFGPPSIQARGKRLLKELTR